MTWTQSKVLPAQLQGWEVTAGQGWVSSLSSSLAPARPCCASAEGKVQRLELLRV